MEGLERFCRVDHSRVRIVEVDPELRIRYGDTYICGVCVQNYTEDQTLSHQEKEAIELDDSRQQLLSFESGVMNGA